jgi:hypothetical protein
VPVTAITIIVLKNKKKARAATRAIDDRYQGLFRFWAVFFFEEAVTSLLKQVRTLILLSNKTAFLHCLGWNRSRPRTRSNISRRVRWRFSQPEVGEAAGRAPARVSWSRRGPFLPSSSVCHIARAELNKAKIIWVLLAQDVATHPANRMQSVATTETSFLHSEQRWLGRCPL